MTRVSLPLSKPRRMGETLRRDTWWVQPLVVFLILTSFIVYATWAAFQNAHYTVPGTNYLSPFYSPELWGDSPHAWFGPKPAWWPSWLPFSPALIILPFPALFRFTCYYYRGAYYKAFWSDPPSCAVGEWRSSYLGEKTFPLVLQNIHRYFMYFAILFLFFLSYDAIISYWFPTPGGGKTFGIGLGSLILTANVICLTGYTIGCHSFRHLVGGRHDRLSRHPIQKKMYDCSSCLNRGHMNWAWVSLFMVAFADIYVRMCSMGYWTDVRIL
jgi:hypothetical protein